MRFCFSACWGADASHPTTDRLLRVIPQRFAELRSPRTEPGWGQQWTVNIRVLAMETMGEKVDNLEPLLESRDTHVYTHACSTCTHTPTPAYRHKCAWTLHVHAHSPDISTQPHLHACTPHMYTHHAHAQCVPVCATFQTTSQDLWKPIPGDP